MPEDVSTEEHVLVQTKDEVLEKMQAHIDAAVELKQRLIDNTEEGMPIKLAFMLASAHDNDEHIQIQLGSSFDPLMMGQVLATACTVNPHVVLGLMDGLAGNPATRDAVTSAIIAMMETLQDVEGDTELALTDVEGTA